MSIFLYPLRYLTLYDEFGSKLYLRNLFALFLISIAISAPFMLTEANYFGEKGFLDRISGFSGVLTGFYIAALVGVASFASSVGDLDEEITNGPIYVDSQDGDKDSLTRREYVCAMFGYLAFVSLFVSVGSILVIVAASAKIDTSNFSSNYPIFYGYFKTTFEITRNLVIVACSTVIAHMFITTCHGLYYMMDRLYYREPQVKMKPTETNKSKLRTNS